MKLLVKSLILSVILLTLSACSKPPTPNFQNLLESRFQNYYLVCPKGYCNLTPNAYSPIYPIPATDLFELFNQLIATQSRISFVYAIPENGQYGLTAHSFIFGLPDNISIQFIALPNNQSTLAIYSKSRYGVYDFGTNKRRAEEWLLQLNQMIARPLQP